MAEMYAAPPSIDRVGRISLIAGIVFLAISVVGLVMDRQAFFQSYLVAFLFVAVVPIGSLALIMLHHVTGGAWGLMIRRTLEAAARTIPVVAILFVPIVLGIDEIFIWADPEVVEHDEVIAGKSAYLNVSAFVARAAIFFGLWWLMSGILGRFSQRIDETHDTALLRRVRAVSAPSLGVWCLLGTFAGIDWLMSLEPHWYSSMYGIYFFESMALAALAFSIVIVVLLARDEPYTTAFRRRHFHDLGNLLLAFVMLWAYFSFSQFLIIWSGNLPEDVPWYLERSTPGWLIFTQVLVVLHLALPFLLLLSHAVKGAPRRLAIVALLVIGMRWADYFWQAAPAMGRGFHWLDLTLGLGLSGLWMAVFCWQLRRRPLLPVGDPRLEDALLPRGGASL